MSRDQSLEYAVWLLVGLLVGLAGYAVVGALWLLNFAVQNALAG